MTLSLPSWRQAGRWLLTAIAITLWTYPVGVILLMLAVISTADSECSTHAELHLDPSGIPWVIGCALLWAAPFVTVAMLRRTKLATALAAIACLVAAFFAAWNLLEPHSGFCF